MNVNCRHGRESWSRLLLSLPAHRVLDEVEDIAKGLDIEDITLPQSGLALLKVRDGAFYEPYYLGEIPLSRAYVRVTDRSGASCEGAALILDDRVGLARAIAVADAVLAGGLDGSERLASLLDDGHLETTKIEALRAEILRRTRVDFSLLEGPDVDKESS